MHVVTCQAVGRCDEHAIDLAALDGIAGAVEPRAGQRTAAISAVPEDERGIGLPARFGMGQNVRDQARGLLLDGLGKEVHAAGNVAFYGIAVITKDATGGVQLKNAADQEPIETVAGVLAGGLVGLLRSKPGGMRSEAPFFASGRLTSSTLSFRIRSVHPWRRSRIRRRNTSRSRATLSTC